MENIKELLNNLSFEENKLIKVNDNLLLTQNQINTLKKYNIDFFSCTSIRDLMIKIEDIIDDDDDEELDKLLYNLEERKYYETTNK